MEGMVLQGWHLSADSAGGFGKIDQCRSYGPGILAGKRKIPGLGGGPPFK